MAAYRRLRIEAQRTGIQEEKKKEAKLEWTEISLFQARETREEFPET